MRFWKRHAEKESRQDIWISTQQRMNEFIHRPDGHSIMKHKSHIHQTWSNHMEGSAYWKTPQSNTFLYFPSLHIEIPFIVILIPWSQSASKILRMDETPQDACYPLSLISTQPSQSSILLTHFRHSIEKKKNHLVSLRQPSKHQRLTRNGKTSNYIIKWMSFHR